MLRLICKAGAAEREQVRELAQELSASPRVAELLIARGITDAEEAFAFLHPSVSGLEDPFLLKDMDKAAACIMAAVENKERIIVFGDYDADGVCATAIMLGCLKELGADTGCMIPSRHEDGKR